MKWTIQLESDGFGFTAEIDNDGDVISAKSPTAHGCLHILAKKVEAKAKGVSYEELIGDQRA